MNGPHRHVQFPGNKIGVVLVFQTITIQSSKRFMLEHFIKQKPLISEECLCRYIQGHVTMHG